MRQAARIAGARAAVGCRHRSGGGARAVVGALRRAALGSADAGGRGRRADARPRSAPATCRPAARRGSIRRRCWRPNRLFVRRGVEVTRTIARHERRRLVHLRTGGCACGVRRGAGGAPLWAEAGTLVFVHVFPQLSGLGSSSQSQIDRSRGPWRSERASYNPVRTPAARGDDRRRRADPERACRCRR